MLRRRLFPQNHNRLGSLQVTLAILIFVDYAHELLARLAAYRHLYRAQAFYVPEGIDKLGRVRVVRTHGTVPMYQPFSHCQSRTWALCAPATFSALLVGFGHVQQGQTFREIAGLFLLTAAGGPATIRRILRRASRSIN